MLVYFGNLQSFPKYLRLTLVFMSNSALPEKFDLYFSRDSCNNLGHNIFRLFDVLPNFPFTTSETNCNC